MAATLDRKRPYGTVHGGTGKTAYEQDGKEFDAAGREIVHAKAAPAEVATITKSTDGATPTVVTKDAQGNLFRDGEILDTDDMTLETLHAMAKDMGLQLHKQTGRVKVLAAIVEAAGPVDQLATQMGD